MWLAKYGWGGGVDIWWRVRDRFIGWSVTSYKLKCYKCEEKWVITSDGFVKHCFKDKTRDGCNGTVDSIIEKLDCTTSCFSVRVDWKINTLIQLQPLLQSMERHFYECSCMAASLIMMTMMKVVWSYDRQVNQMIWLYRWGYMCWAIIIWVEQY